MTRSKLKFSPRVSKASAILSLTVTLVVLVAWTYHVFGHPPTNKIGYLFTVPFFAAGILNLYLDCRNIRQPTDFYVPGESFFVLMMIFSWEYDFDSRNFMICSGLLTFLIVFIAAMLRVSIELGHPISRRKPVTPAK